MKIIDERETQANTMQREKKHTHTKTEKNK